MFAKALLVFSLLFTHLSFAQIEESHVDFTISPAALVDGHIQVAYEWLEPAQMKTKEMNVIDLPKVSSLHPSSNHMVAAKIAFISKKSFDSLNYSMMNRASYISAMLHSVAISQKGPDLWVVTNKVKAYNLPFKITFDFRIKEVSAAGLGAAANYLRTESAGLKGTGRERFLILDMSNFSQLMYRNYSIVYMKELGPKETLVVSGVVGGLNKTMADRVFNIPPFSTTKKTMMDNFETQIMHMAREIQN